MKTTLLLIALSFSITYSFSQTTLIPDTAFEQALIDQGIDTNGLNGNILNSDASFVQNLSVNGLGITDLSGIEAFGSLLSLNCNYNSLTTLDLSSNTALTFLDCNNNVLTSLNLGTNNLEYLFCNSNLLTGLNLSIDTALIQLDCSQNQLTELNLKNGNNTAIQFFNAIDNPNLNCIGVDDPSYSNMYWINIDPQTFFSYDCSNTQTTYIPDTNFEQALIDLGHDDVLDDYVLTGRIIGITTLDVSSKSIIDLTGIEDFLSLINLNCSNNSITSLNVTNHTALKNLNCYNNKISTLDFSANTALETLNCNKNLLTSLNISNNSALTDLSCGENYVTLTSIDVSQNINLKSLNIQSNNWMTSLDVTNNTALESLVANGAPITNLDLTQNIALLGLECQYCSLSTLDVSQNVALMGINVGYNYLVNLDLSNNSNLLAIATLYNNSLVSLNVKNGNNSNINSFSFNATHCNSLDCITVDDVAYSTTNWSAGIDAGVIFSTNCTLGIDEFNESQLALYPNPVKDKFTIDINLDSKYSLISMQGQEIKKGTLLSGTNNLDISTVSTGLYFLNIETPKGRVTKKLIKD